ncbi:RAQPRD family integrative conjugative element protein [Cronobacter malonaticus]
MFYPALNKLAETIFMRKRSQFLLLALLTGPQVWASPESTQLALALKQLDGVKTSLERARISSSTNPQSRYFFDYLQAQQDIATVGQGIRRYLAPARAQPRAVQPLNTNYQRENPDD